ncbi:MAG: DUF998 domain-containing protein [Thermoplasmatales archaeon]|jgi:hypothetical membrane protein|nr:DUF998 domain-containing protein [Candidatus Thermoplasmatota archaeon]MCL6003591.1 DUF998 domain-containing protein [Candidatus Thermoplasmatota archaeon]MDA8054764.1 DUF998 domain-containing protein [Thermoplasmatales archaeon]
MEKVASRKNLNIAGVFLFVFSIQFVIMMFVTEALYPHYSIANNYISDLGIGSTGPLFDTSIALLGIAVIASSYFIYRGFDVKIFPILIALTGLGALLVGIFNENFGSIHGYVSDFTFILGPLTAIYAYRYQTSPFKFISVSLGIISYLAIALPIMFGDSLLGVGGWERLIVYPFLLWGAGYGAFLMGLSYK